MDNSVAAREQDRYNALRYVLADRRGRQFLQMVIDESGLHGTTDCGDAHGMAVLEGRRQLGMWVRDAMMHHDPDTYVTLVREQREREAYYETLEFDEGETE